MAALIPGLGRKIDAGWVGIAAVGVGAPAAGVGIVAGSEDTAAAGWVGIAVAVQGQRGVRHEGRSRAVGTAMVPGFKVRGQEKEEGRV